jgi:multidrug efflux system membrane fusion protein
MRKTTHVVASVVAASLLAACSHSSTDDSKSGSGKKGKGKFGSDGPIPVTVTTASKQDVPVYLNGLGSVVAFNTATILAQVSGQLVSVPFKEGDEIESGALLAQIDPRPFQATLDQAIAKKAQDQAVLNSARLDLKRYIDLQPDGYVSGQQVDQQAALVKQDEALVQADEASIESSRVQLSFTHITAPFTGVAGIRQVDVGNLVSSGSATGIVVLTQIKPISITFTLPEQKLPQIRAAGGGPLAVLAVTRDNQTELARGELAAFDSQIDATTGTIKLKATFPNQDKNLWPGQFVNARLLVSTEKGALTVPSPAVQLGPNGSFVYKVQQDHTAQMQPVTVSMTEGNFSVITQGLNEGDTVVVDGQSRLQPGSKVQIGGGSSGGVGASGAGGASSGSSSGAADAADASSSGGSGDQASQHHHHHHGASSGGDGGGSSGTNPGASGASP